MPGSTTIIARCPAINPYRIQIPSRSGGVAGQQPSMNLNLAEHPDPQYLRGGRRICQVFPPRVGPALAAINAD